MKKIYKNYDDIKNEHTFHDFIKWSRERRANKKDLSVGIEQYEQKEIEKLQENRTKISITWIGHSTFLIQANGLNILTDPVWANRMGAQKRLTKPGLALSELPPIDIILISHGHYDHLHFGSIRRIKGEPTIYVPIGLKSAFTRRGYKKVIEANWWDDFKHKELHLHFVPAQHWTKRTLNDTNTSHWGGWVLQGATKDQPSIYFVGDTGYFRGFKEIQERYSLDYVLMPIGAYEPEWFMAVSHINPEDAVKAFLELKGKYFIPMHYGAYRLADDTGPEALARLTKEWERLQLEEEKLKALLIGETLWV